MSFTNIKNKDFIYEKMRSSRYGAYQVFAADSRSLIDESEGERSIEETIGELDKCLMNLEGIVFVVIRPVGSKRRAKAISGSDRAQEYDRGVLKFRLDFGTGGGGSFPGGGNMNLFQMYLGEVEKRHKLELDMSERIRKLEEANREDGGVISGEMGEKVMKLIDRLIEDGGAKRPIKRK